MNNQEFDINNIINHSTVIYGPSGSGKTILIKDVLN